MYKTSNGKGEDERVGGTGYIDKSKCKETNINWVGKFGFVEVIHSS